MCKMQKGNSQGSQKQDGQMLKGKQNNAWVKKRRQAKKSHKSQTAARRTNVQKAKMRSLRQKREAKGKKEKQFKAVARWTTVKR